MNPAASLPTGRAVPRPARRQSAWLDDLRAHVVRQSARLRHPGTWSLRGRTLAVVLVLYVVATVLVLVPGTFVGHVDKWVVLQNFGPRHESWKWWVDIVVGMGQRWIMTYILQVVFIIACLRARSLRPMVYFVTALVLLNSSVGVVKTITGRVGPFHQHNVTLNAHRVFHLGGDIYPSGHVSNAVVMFGVLAMAIPRLRRLLVPLAVAASVGVGLGTLYLRTHWVSDVVGGWIAGVVVLLVLPSVVPWADRIASALASRVRVVVRNHRRLHRVCHAVLHAALRVVPADSDYWRTGARATSAGRHRADLPARRRFEPVRAAAPADEFADWPRPTGRERETV